MQYNAKQCRSIIYANAALDRPNVVRRVSCMCDGWPWKESPPVQMSTLIGCPPLSSLPPPLRANVDIIPFLPIQLSRRPRPLATFAQNEALGIKPILSRPHVYIWLIKVYPTKEEDQISNIAPKTHLSVTQPILLSLSPLLLAAPAPQIIAGALEFR